MPTYGPLGTTVSLYTWEADTERALSGQGDSSQAFEVEVEVERIREDRFDNQGLDFLGPSSAPFYLVNAGQDLFSPASASSDGNVASAIDVLEKSKRLDSTPAPMANTPAAAASHFPRTPPDHALAESDQDTTLSSINSALFHLSPQVSEGTISIDKKRGGVDGGGADSASSRHTKNSNKIFTTLKPTILVGNAVSKPITSPKPMKLQIDLSNRSFMPSLITDIPGDICVSVFYNGEFMYSKIFRWSTFNSGQKSECGHPTVSGRRIGSNIEVPWVIKPIPQDLPSSLVKKDLSMARATWGRIGQSLLTEADEWGREGKFDMFRTPVGEYLECLSKLPIPKRAWPLGVKGLNIGVVDVIIGLGRSLNHPYRFLHAPQRKLTQDWCGLDHQLFVVPKELSLFRLRQMIDTFQDEDNKKKVVRASRSVQRFGTRRKAGESSSRRAPKSGTSQNSAAVKPTQRSRSTTMSTSVSSVDPVEIADASESYPAGHDGFIERGRSSSQYMAFNIPDEVSPLKSSKGSMTSAARIGSNLQQKPSHSTQLPNSRIYQSVPQKRYRGPSPPPPEVEEVISVSSEPPSHSTRSRTSAGSSNSPAIVSPPASTPRHSQNPVDRIPDVPPHRHRAKSRRLSESNKMALTGNPFGLDGLEDDYYEYRPDGMSLSRPPDSPMRQLASAETNQLYRGDLDFGLDGSGDVPRSTKRKRPAVEASTSEVAPRTKVRRTNAKGPKSSDTQSTLSADETNTAGSDTGTVTHVEIASVSRTNGPLSQTQEGNTATRKPRQRNPLSARELGSLLEPHKPSVDADTSFGQSFVDFPSRPTRNSTKQKAYAKVFPTTRPRVTATLKDGRTLIIKGLRPSELTREDKKVQTSEEKKRDALGLSSTSKTSSDQGATGIVAPQSLSSSVAANIISRTTKQIDNDVELDPLVAKDTLHTIHKSTENLQSGMKLEREGKHARAFDLNRNQNRGFLDSELALLSPTNSKYSLARNRENIRPSTKSGTPSLVGSLQSQGPGTTAANFDETVLPPLNDKQQLASAHDVERSGPADILRNEQLVARQESASTGAPLIARVQKPSVKMPPVMKFKAAASTIRHAEPQTPNKKQAKTKPELTIQTGVANSYRTYDVSSTGQKTPTPRSAPLPPTDPPRTRVLNRALHATHEDSAITMPSMVEFTPQRNTTPRHGFLADHSSSATVPSPSNMASSSRALRSSKRSSTSIVADLTKSQPTQTKSSTVQQWRPTNICRESVLSYVDDINSEGLPGLNYDKGTGRMCRANKYEREGVFRTSSVLMGVRYVFGLGSETAKF